MTESTTKLPVKKEEAGAERLPTQPGRHPVEALRREIDRLFDDFDPRGWISPLRRSIFDIESFWPRERILAAAPAVDIAESNKAYEVTAELPGLDEKDIEVKVVNGYLTIKGEKEEEKDEKKKDYHLHERHFGSFERIFRLPEGVDSDRIEASFRKGVLAVILPKTPEAQKAEKKITVKVA